MKYVLCFLLTAATVFGKNAQIEVIDNYNNWGWDNVYVMQNDLITLATVPSIGARVMQYDIGSHASIAVNPALLGQVQTPAANSGWPNFGGFKNWPAPQDAWGWPPPPVIDFGEYSAEIVANTPDSVTLKVTGQVEQWKTPGIYFIRYATLYKGSSRIKMEQIIVNNGNEAVNWGIWDITQSIVQHENSRDWEHFWVYFPINPNSVFGEDGVNYAKTDAAWTGEAASGIYGVQFNPSNKKIFADVSEGWICYVDEREGAAYAKTFDLFPGAEYPDGGANIAVWINGGSFPYLEVEVMSPVVELTANGGNYWFTENWWATRINGPILAVNKAGAVAEKLGFDPDGQTVIGKYGVFHKGSVKAAAIAGDGTTVVTESEPVSVNPDTPLLLAQPLAITAMVESVEVRAYDEAGTFIAVLDSRSLSEMTGVTQNIMPDALTLHPNFPNPFNPSTQISFTLKKAEHIKLSIFNTRGEQVTTLKEGLTEAGHHLITWNAKNAASGVYFARLICGNQCLTQKLIYMQ